MIRGKTFLRSYGLADTFQAYRNAMSRRRPEGVLPQNALGRYIRRSYIYLDVASGSALFGQLRHVAGCGFIVTGKEVPQVFRGVLTTKVLVTNIINYRSVLEE